jgi:L-iditol 2-dehydrogenase
VRKTLGWQQGKVEILVQRDEAPYNNGAGPIGFSIAFAARTRGAAPVIIAEPVPERRSLAASLGFQTLDITPDPVAAIRDLTGGGADVTFEAAGDPRAVNWAAAATRLGSRCCIVGIPAEDSIPIDLHTLRRAELTLLNCRRSNRTLPEALRLIAGPASDLARIITHRFDVSDADRAFNLVSQKADGAVKVMLTLEG